MAWLSLSVAIVGWLVGSFVVLTFRGKHVSRRFAVLALILSTFGAGAVQYVLYRGVERTKRLSGAHLVGVTSVRMQDDSDFIRKYLTASDSQQLRRQDID